MNLFFWYNLSMENLVNNYLNNTSSSNEYYTTIQLRLPLDLETIISFDDPIYTFDEVLRGCNVEKYLKSDIKDPRGRIGFNLVTMLKVVLFGYMINGNISTRKLEKLCVNDIRFRWLLRNEKSFPSHMTICNFMNHYLKDNIEDIFKKLIHTYLLKIMLILNIFISMVLRWKLMLINILGFGKMLV